MEGLTRACTTSRNKVRHAKMETRPPNPAGPPVSGSDYVCFGRTYLRYGTFQRALLVSFPISILLTRIPAGSYGAIFASINHCEGEAIERSSGHSVSDVCMRAGNVLCGPSAFFCLSSLSSQWRWIDDRSHPTSERTLVVSCITLMMSLPTFSSRVFIY